MKYVKITRRVEGVPVTHLDPIEYIERLPGMRDDLPPGAWAFASDPDHYDFPGARSVKDLRLHSIAISYESPEGVSVTARFAPNPFKHDDFLVIVYAGVWSFETTLSYDAHWANDGGEIECDYADLGDIWIDEILSSDRGCSHEIALHGGTMTIVSRDLVASWEHREEPLSVRFHLPASVRHPGDRVMANCRACGAASSPAATRTSVSRMPIFRLVQVPLKMADLARYLMRSLLITK